MTGRRRRRPRERSDVAVGILAAAAGGLLAAAAVVGWVVHDRASEPALVAFVRGFDGGTAFTVLMVGLLIAAALLDR